MDFLDYLCQVCVSSHEHKTGVFRRKPDLGFADPNTEILMSSCFFIASLVQYSIMFLYKLVAKLSVPCFQVLHT